MNMKNHAITGQVKEFGVIDLFKVRNFRLLWLGQVISDFGNSLTNMTLLFLVNRLTGSTAALATMMIMLAIPEVTFGLFAGVFVDRLDRKRVIILSDILRGFFVLGFILVDSPEKIWLLYVIGFIQATIGTFFYPARNALLPNLIPESGLLSANSVAETSRIIFNLFGVGVAGAIVGTLNIFWPAFTIDALTFFTSFLLISQIRGYTRGSRPKTSINVKAIFSELVDGLQITVRTPALLGTMVGAGIAMLGLGATNVLLVPLLVNDLQVPETWFAGLEFAQTSSMVISGGLVATLASRFESTRIASVGLVLLGLVVVLISQSQNVWHIMATLFALGWVLTPLQASFATIVQTAVKDEVRGRSSAARGAVISASNLISMAFAGILGDMIGIRNVFIIGGIFSVLAGWAAAKIYSKQPPLISD
ncbi:MAG: MFS transporter [Chloroflexota bacterium]